MIFHTLWAYLYYAFLLVCCGYAIMRGGRSEYYGAGIMTLGSLSTLAVARAFGSSWSQVEVGIFVIDVVGLVALIFLAFRSDRFWPMWAASFQLLAVTVHTVMLLDPQITPWAFGTGAVFWAYPMLLALAIGSCENVVLAPDRRVRAG